MTFGAFFMTIVNYVRMIFKRIRQEATIENGPGSKAITTGAMDKHLYS
jgi:hypothetical protein